MGRSVRQLDVQKIIAGAIKGGMPLGSFSVKVDAEHRTVVILPLSGNAAPADEDDLDAEIRKLMDGDH